MAYPYGFTPEDLLQRFSQTRIDEITDNQPAKIEQAAIDTAAEIELFASRYYVTPLDPFAAGLRTIFLDLWRWRLLFNCKPEWLNTSDKDSEEYAIAARRKQLELWLAGLGSDSRETVLPGATEISASRSTNASAWSTGSSAVMTRAALLKI